jgi:hypothetical protein
MTGGSGGQVVQHRKGGLCRRQRCSPDAERVLGDRNAAIQQNSIWSIAFEACAKAILNEVC